MKLSQGEKGILLLSARESIYSLFDEVRYPSIDYKMYPTLAKKQGAFVTLLSNTQLRGCIGYIYSDLPIFETVCQAAKLAATEDPRFPPLIEEELSQIMIEISVLSLPTPIKDYNDIEIGVHGVILVEEDGRGVLLPQVAVEQKWDLPDYLSGICQKAGLEPNTWKNRFLNLSTFTAQVFAEEKHRNITGEAH
jgi:uncharacterized protein